MYPHLRDGDRVIVSTKRPPRVGDVVIYKKVESNTFVAHRIIKTTQDAFITKGDNSLCRGEAISRHDVLGVVLYVIRDHKVHRFRSNRILARFWFLDNLYLFL